VSWKVSKLMKIDIRILKLMEQYCLVERGAKAKEIWWQNWMNSRHYITKSDHFRHLGKAISKIESWDSAYQWWGNLQLWMDEYIIRNVMFIVTQRF
jgi:hypothetical protein